MAARSVNAPPRWCTYNCKHVYTLVYKYTEYFRATTLSHPRAVSTSNLQLPRSCIIIYIYIYTYTCVYTYMIYRARSRNDRKRAMTKFCTRFVDLKANGCVHGTDECVIETRGTWISGFLEIRINFNCRPVNRSETRHKLADIMFIYDLQYRPFRPFVATTTLLYVSLSLAKLFAVYFSQCLLVTHNSVYLSLFVPF